uniref:Uncharacterized protein n=1 Tax=Ixodes scapularis TaxID=6945 RepID=A0A1S4L4H4_IXOSC
MGGVTNCAEGERRCNPGFCSPVPPAEVELLERRFVARSLECPYVINADGVCAARRPTSVAAPVASKGSAGMP